MKDLRGIDREDMEAISDIIYMKLLQLLRDPADEDTNKIELQHSGQLEEVVKLWKQSYRENLIYEIQPSFDVPCDQRILIMSKDGEKIICDLDVFLKTDKSIENEFKKSLDENVNESFWKNAKLDRNKSRKGYDELKTKLLSLCD